MAKKLALNDQLEQQLAALAKKKNLKREDVLLQAIGLMKYLEENDATVVVAKKADGSAAGEVAL